MAIATIAIGIAAATAVFSVIDPLLSRRLPYPKDFQLVFGYFGPINDVEFNVVASYLEWRERQTVFQSITSMRPGAGATSRMETLRGSFPALPRSQIS